MDDTKRILGLPAFEQDAAFRRVLARMHGTEAPTATIGRYELIRRLGAGGMGIVYLVRDPILDRRVALKLLHDRLGHDADSDAFARRMRREAWAMARLHHPQVVRVYGVGEHEGRIFVVMEHVEGTTLADWLEARARGWDEVVRAFVAAGEGLAAAHEAGLVHGDFKAENVLVGDDGSIKVGDFGLVRSRGDVTEHGGPAAPGGRGCGARPRGWGRCSGLRPTWRRSSCGGSGASRGATSSASAWRCTWRSTGGRRSRGRPYTSGCGRCSRGRGDLWLVARRYRLRCGRSSLGG